MSTWPSSQRRVNFINQNQQYLPFTFWLGWIFCRKTSRQVHNKYNFLSESIISLFWDRHHNMLARNVEKDQSVTRLLIRHIEVNNNQNNNRIQRRYSRFFTMSSQHRELSPTRTLKRSGHNRVQITCNTSSAYHVQVSCHVPLSTKGQLSY